MNELHNEFKFAAKHLRQAANLLNSYWDEDGQAIFPGSLAQSDEMNTTYDDAWGRATYEVAHQPPVQTIVVFDHLHAMSAVLTSPKTALAASTLARTTLIALGVLNYLYEPGTTPLERVRRRANTRLAYLVEQQNLLLGMTQNPGAGLAARKAIPDGGITIRRIELSAKRFGLTPHHPKARNTKRGPRFLGERVPSDQRLVTDLLADPDETDRDLWPTLHRLTSANAHAQAHGLHPFMLSADATADPAVAGVQFGLDQRHLVMLVGSVIFGVQRTAARLAEYYGWPPQPWVQFAREFAVSHSRWR